MFLTHPPVKVSIVGSLRDREVACSASDRQGSNFESCVWRTVSSQSSHHPQEVLLAQFSLYVHKGSLKPIHFISFCWGCKPAGISSSKRKTDIDPILGKSWPNIDDVGSKIQCHVFDGLQLCHLLHPQADSYSATNSALSVAFFRPTQRRCNTWLPGSSKNLRRWMICYINHGDQRFFLILYHKRFSYIFLIHLNTYNFMGRRTL